MRNRKKGFIKAIESGIDLFNDQVLMHLHPKSKNYTFQFWDHLSSLAHDLKKVKFKEYCLALSQSQLKESEKLEKRSSFLFFLLEKDANVEFIEIFLDFSTIQDLDLLEKLLEISKLDSRDYHVYSRLVVLDFDVLQKELSLVFKILSMENAPSGLNGQDYRIKLAIEVLESFANARKLDDFISRFLEDQNHANSFLMHKEVLKVLAVQISKVTSSISAQIFSKCIGLYDLALSNQEISKIHPISLILLVISRHLKVSAGTKLVVLKGCEDFHSKILLPCLENEALLDYGVDILSVFHGLIAAFYFYSQEYVTSDLVLKILNISSHKNNLLELWQTKIALSHVDSIASTIHDPSQVHNLKLIVSKLNLKKLKRFEGEEHVFSLLSHLAVICRLGSKEQVKTITKYVLNILRSNNSMSETILRTAVFFEITQIRDCFLQVWFHQIKKELKEICQTHSSAQMFQKLLIEAQNDQQSVDFQERCDLIFSNDKVDNQRILQDQCDLKGLLDLISSLNRFPTHYFTNAESKKIVSVLILLDKAIYIAEDRSSLISLISKTRTLLSTYLKRCQHNSILLTSKNYIFHLLNSVDQVDFSGFTNEEENIKWETISILQDIGIKSATSKSMISYLKALLQYREQSVSKISYWDYALFSTLHLIKSKKRPHDDLEAVVKIDELSMKVLDHVFSGKFDCRMDLILFKEIMKLLEKVELTATMNSCIDKLQYYHASSTVGDSSWLFSYEALCSCIKYIPNEIFMELLDSGMENMAADSVRKGITQMIRLCNGDQSLIIAETIIKTLSSIIKSLNSSKTESNEAECVITLLNVFFEMDSLPAGGRHILERVAIILNSLLIICAITPNIKWIYRILEFCHCLIINKKFVLSETQIGQIMEIISVIGESNIILDLAEEKLSLFEHIYVVTNDIVRYQRESLINVIPHFINILQDLLKCFQENQEVYRYKAQEAPRNKFRILNQGINKLPVKAASLYSNIIMSMTQKPSRETSEEPLLMSQSSRFIKPFSKHAPFLLIEFITIQSSKRQIHSNYKKEITNGMYSLLNLCSKHGHDFVLATLDPHTSARPLFKKLVSEWESDYKFNGL